MDWDNCIVCGNGDGELRCPADRTAGDAKDIYGCFLENVNGFREIDKMPVELAISQSITVEILLQNRAKWHKMCNLKFASSKLQRTRQRHETNESMNTSSERKSRRLSSGPSVGISSPQSCLFCTLSAGTLHNCSTLSLDKTLREMATDLQDKELLSRIAGGDLVAIEAKYHNKCLTNYKNKHRSMKRKQQTLSCETYQEIADSRVFAELASYIESEVEEGIYIFKLSDLHYLFEKRLKILGFSKTINKTRLKSQLLIHFSPECQEQTDGKNTLLVFNEGMQRLLKEALVSRDFEQEALSMARVSKCVRKEICDGDFFKFSGSFSQNCEEQSVPTSLKSLVSMLLYGPNIKHQTMKNSRACLTICQLILFNFKEKSSGTNNPRHDKIREPPLSLYVGLDIHSLTRSKKLVTEFCELGLSVSYQRVLEVEDWLTTGLCKRYTEEDLVCPSPVRTGLFTAGALDNIDHNPTSTSAKGSFHGTSISIFQFPSQANPGICRKAITVPVEGWDNFVSLPESYSIVPAVTCNTSTIKVAPSVMRELDKNLEDATAREKKWFETSIPLMSKEKLEKGVFVSWSAHHASCQNESVEQAGISTLLPLFYEKAATISMIKHGMTVIGRIVAKTNPGQVPIIAVDQPLFALAKYVQWNWPDSHGEDLYVMMLGGLHIEIALWRVVGDLLEDSGWTEALTEADVASSGTADSFISAAHLTKTRHAHQVTALALAKLQQEACQILNGRVDDEAFVAWKDLMTEKSSMFKYWDLILRLETLVLIFVRAHREQNFTLYVNVLEMLVPFFFILDHTNYARWLPVHIRDMKSLPDFSKNDIKKYWVFPKTNRNFSSIPLDQAHEQNNKSIKDSGGAIGLTEKPGALKRWMISGPENVRLLKEFQKNDIDKNQSGSHEQGISKQESFKRQVSSLCNTIDIMGNPFLEESEELMKLDTHDCADQKIRHAIGTIESNAKIQYDEYVQSVLIDRTKPIQSPIKKNKLPLFKRPPTKGKPKAKQNKDDLRSDYSLFSQLFIASQVREGDLDKFFSHENHPWPPALSQHGRLRLPTCKSELLECLDQNNEHEAPHIAFETKIFDGAAVVHSLPKGNVSTFGEYSQNAFIPWTKRQLQSCQRIDIVWDTYKSDSLKDATREKRGQGTRKKVSRQTRLPVNFNSFLRNSKNKEELFELLTGDVSTCEYPEDKAVYITAGQSVVAKGCGTQMPLTDHEEADTRICLHVQDAIQKGSVSLIVSTVDTDVVVILLGIFPHLLRISSELQLWVEFGKGKHLRYYHINSVYNRTGEDVSVSLPFFHAFTGCDTTSQFGGKGKKTSWKAWKSFPEVTASFFFPLQHPFIPFEVHSEEFKYIERFTCVLYDHTTQLDKVNDLRQELFAQGKHVKLMQNLPPTQASLLQHSNRSLYQANIWLTSLQLFQNAPSPENFGWTKSNDNWQPLWTTLPEAAKSCRELIKCGCKAMPLCSRKCICKNTHLKCTYLCACKGNC